MRAVGRHRAMLDSNIDGADACSLNVKTSLSEDGSRAAVLTMKRLHPLVGAIGGPEASVDKQPPGFDRVKALRGRSLLST